MKGFSQLKHDDVDGAHRFFAFAAFLIGALTGFGLGLIW